MTTRAEWLVANMSPSDDGCVLWPFRTDRDGYAPIYYEGKETQAHRVVCRLTHGEPIGDADQATHECGARSCISDRHIVWGSREKNMQDKLRHDTHARGERCATHRLSEAGVQDIVNLSRLGVSVASLAGRFGVHRRTIYDILQGRNWSWLTGIAGPATSQRGETTT